MAQDRGGGKRVPSAEGQTNKRRRQWRGKTKGERKGRKSCLLSNHPAGEKKKNPVLGNGDGKGRKGKTSLEILHPLKGRGGACF